MDFRSDHATGIAPAILDAIVRANAGADTSYGGDAISARLAERFSAVFEIECVVFPVISGTAANALSLACLAPPWSAIYCHKDAHIEQDECGAPEFFTGGAKLSLLGGAEGRIATEDFAQALADAPFLVPHHVQPKALSIAQATECGTVYRPEHVAALAQAAARHAMVLHMDGARFANALAFLDCRPADVTWRAGVAALSFGATKNGAMAAEAVVFFNRKHAAEFAYRRKRGGHLMAKMRFIAAQLEAYLAGDLWLANARHANAMARRLADGLGALRGVRLGHPVEANEVFVYLPARLAAGLTEAGYRMHLWSEAADGQLFRLVASFDTRPEVVDGLIKAAAKLSAATKR